MEHNPSWEANRLTVSQIPHILWNSKPATGPYSEPEQSTPCLPSHFLRIHFNNILQSTHGSSNWSLSLRLPHQMPVCTSSLPIRATCTTHLILLDFITRKMCGEEYRSWSSSLCSFLHSPVTSSLLGPNILLSTLFSNRKLSHILKMETLTSQNVGYFLPDYTASRTALVTAI